MRINNNYNEVYFFTFAFIYFLLKFFNDFRNAKGEKEKEE